MVERIAGNCKLPDALAAENVERADGVPLFVEELTRAVIDAVGRLATPEPLNVRIGIATGLVVVARRSNCWRV